MNESESPDLGSSVSLHTVAACPLRSVLRRDSPSLLHNYRPVDSVVSHDVCMVNMSVNVRVLMYTYKGLNG